MPAGYRRATLRYQRALLLFMVLISVPHWLDHFFQSNRKVLFHADKIESILSDPESALAAGMRIPLQNAPLDLLEQVVKLPSSSAELLWKEKDTICLKSPDISPEIPLQTIPGIGEKRATRAAKFLLIPQCPE